MIKQTVYFSCDTCKVFGENTQEKSKEDVLLYLENHGWKITMLTLDMRNIRMTCPKCLAKEEGKDESQAIFKKRKFD